VIHFNCHRTRTQNLQDFIFQDVAVRPIYVRPAWVQIGEGSRGSCHNPLSFMADDDLKFRHPFSCIVSGPSKSGKTSFCIRLLQYLVALCTESEFGGGIVWCYSEKTAVSAVALEHHISRGRTGQLWWRWRTAPRDPRRFVK